MLNYQKVTDLSNPLFLFVNKHICLLCFDISMFVVSKPIVCGCGEMYKLLLATKSCFPVKSTISGGLKSPRSAHIWVNQLNGYPDSFVVS